MRRAAAPTRIRLENTPPLVPVLDRYRCNGRLAVLLYEEDCFSQQLNLGFHD